jgi:hypothetical protein
MGADGEQMEAHVQSRVRCSKALVNRADDYVVNGLAWTCARAPEAADDLGHPVALGLLGSWRQATEAAETRGEEPRSGNRLGTKGRGLRRGRRRSCPLGLTRCLAAQVGGHGAARLASSVSASARLGLADDWMPRRWQVDVKLKSTAAVSWWSDPARPKALLAGIALWRSLL